MGIPALWELLGDGELTSIAQLAAGHFQRTGRELRIAIDEAGWRFNNLNEFQVYQIRERSNEPAYNGIEKNIFYRLARLLKLNIRPLFVFDGPSRPWKRGKVAGRIEYTKIDLLKKLLDVLGIPHHVAPAEAEAECARLQQEGIVDAVWSEDADALMFGCGMLIRDYRVSKNNKKGGTEMMKGKADTKKSDSHVRVYRSNDILKAHGLDREGLVLFTVLCGGDYNAGGLKGCGPKKALRAVKTSLGKSLCACQSEAELAAWRVQLNRFFEGEFNIPVYFPKYRDVKNYNAPKVSYKEQLHNIRGLRQGWDIALNEEKLRDFISSRFNIWTRGYMKWIAPILLVRFLAKAAPEQWANPHDVKVKRKRKVKGKDDTSSPAETKISFSPFALTSLNMNELPNGHWLGKYGEPPELEHRVEDELLDCILRRGLPEEVFEAPTPKLAKTSKKRIALEEEANDLEQQPPIKRKRKIADSTNKKESAGPNPSAGAGTSLQKSNRPLPPMFVVPRGLDPLLLDAAPKPQRRADPPTVPVASRLPRHTFSDEVIDLTGDFDSPFLDISGTDDEDLEEAIRLSLEDEGRSVYCGDRHSSPHLERNTTQTVALPSHAFSNSTSASGTPHASLSYGPYEATRDSPARAAVTPSMSETERVRAARLLYFSGGKSDNTARIAAKPNFVIDLSNN